jgi:programmed cell death 6-interacting protein
MFNYINENFLHAPSTDLSRETVKTLISIMLAQGQEVFLEKQIADGKKVGLLAKLASQAATLYAQAVEGTIENVAKAVFERVWLLLVQTKASYMSSLSQYYQASADDDANSHGTAIARLYLAETQAKEAVRIAQSFPSSVPPASNLPAETGAALTEMTKRHLANVQEKLATLIKDNDYIYHQTVPVEASLSVVPKLPAAKAIPVSELYQGQDIQRIIGPDIFQKIVPMSVTESASLYDEEKAKLVRAEAEKVEQANDEMAASLDYLKLPSSLNVLKGGMDQETAVDEEFRRWCEELAGHEPFNREFESLQADKASILSMLESCTRSLDLEENVCEKMRVKYSSDWTQQPSSRLNSTLRSDLRSYRGAIDEAGGSDAQLLGTARQYEADFEEMRSAGETDEADVLYQRAMIKAGGSRGKKDANSPNAENTLLDEDYGEGGVSVMDQIAKIEDLLKKLNLIKRDRTQVLKDLKEKVCLFLKFHPKVANANFVQVHNDDISNVLILNKKSIANHENKLFEAELEKFRSHQNRLLQANHKQTALMKELTKSYGELLQDKRVRSEQSKYESFNRQRSTVLTRYRKVYQAFNDLVAGLDRAQRFYSEMKETVENVEQNVNTFVNNRREEGGQLLAQIERKKQSNAGGQSEQERDRLRDLMERMTVSPATPSSPPQRTKSSASRPSTTSSRTPQAATAYAFPTQSTSPYNGGKPPIPGYGIPQTHSPQPYPVYPPQPPAGHPAYAAHTQPGYPIPPGYDPTRYPPQGMPLPQQMPGYAPQGYAPYQQLPQGYVPPPPPPGPPPGSQQIYGGYGSPQQQQQPRQGSAPPGYHQGQQAGQQQGDPWAGLAGWK